MPILNNTYKSVQLSNDFYQKDCNSFYRRNRDEYDTGVFEDDMLEIVAFLENREDFNMCQYMYARLFLSIRNIEGQMDPFKNEYFQNNVQLLNDICEKNNYWAPCKLDIEEKYYTNKIIDEELISNKLEMSTLYKNKVVNKYYYVYKDKEVENIKEEVKLDLFTKYFEILDEVENLNLVISNKKNKDINVNFEFIKNSRISFIIDEFPYKKSQKIIKYSFKYKIIKIINESLRKYLKSNFNFNYVINNKKNKLPRIIIPIGLEEPNLSFFINFLTPQEKYEINGKKINNKKLMNLILDRICRLKKFYIDEENFQYINNFASEIQSSGKYYKMVKLFPEIMFLNLYQLINVNKIIENMVYILNKINIANLNLLINLYERITKYHLEFNVINAYSRNRIKYPRREFLEYLKEPFEKEKKEIKEFKNNLEICNEENIEYHYDDDYFGIIKPNLFQYDNTMEIVNLPFIMNFKNPIELLFFNKKNIDISGENLDISTFNEKEKEIYEIYKSESLKYPKKLIYSVFGYPVKNISKFGQYSLISNCINVYYVKNKKMSILNRIPYVFRYNIKLKDKKLEKIFEKVKICGEKVIINNSFYYKYYNYLFKNNYKKDLKWINKIDEFEEKYVDPYKLYTDEYLDEKLFKMNEKIKDFIDNDPGGFNVFFKKNKEDNLNKNENKIFFNDAYYKSKIKNIKIDDQSIEDIKDEDFIEEEEIEYKEEDYNGRNLKEKISDDYYDSDYDLQEQI